MAEPSPSLLTPLYNLDGYRKYFANADTWKPFVSLVCHRHALPIVGSPRSGLPGTFPTFIVSDHWVVKFFGAPFDGLACFQVEQAASDILPHDFPVPALLASGSLYPPGTTDFHWPYLIYEYIPAVSIGEVYAQVSYPAKLALARQLGSLLSRMHRLSLPPDSVFYAGWQSYLQHLTHLASDCQERHIAWGSLPANLLSEISAYLLPPSSLLPLSSSPSLIHADLTRDHLLGDLLSDGDWCLRAIIDFGDAISGDLFYELVVLHLEIFDTDLRLLREFLDVYQSSPFHQQNFIRKAMTLTLLHPYDAFATVFTNHPDLKRCASLDELACLLWGV
jgi:hygromycin-B 7''-O-kinase